MRTRTLGLVLGSVCGLALGWAGCTGGLDSLGGGAAGDFGATPGGVKDLHLARELIAAGQIPPPDALLVEAMYAEHDLALEGPTCARALCLRAAAGFAPELDGTPRGFAQVGLSSTIDPAAWERPSTTFVFTVDVSGSMGWGYEGTTPGELSRQLLHALTEELRPDDRVALVTYGSEVATRLALTSGESRARVHGVIDELAEAGSTNMEAGMQRAYAIGASALGSTQQVRVIVFTDTQPNVGATAPSEFQRMVTAASDKGVHTTTLALGLGIGPEVLRAMASMRGANAYSMTSPEEVDAFMADDYPWFTTPIAFTLRVGAELAAGWTIDRGLGFPAASDAQEVGLQAETVFLSRRKGAMLIALTPPASAPASPAGLGGSFSLSYTQPDGTPVAEALPFGHDGAPLDARGQWFGQRGVARTTALGLLVEGMHDAAARYAADPAAAEAVMRAAATRFAADAEALGDADLPVEVELSAAMLQLIAARAPQGTLYGR